MDLPHTAYELGLRFKSLWSFKQFLSPREVHIGFRYMTAARGRARDERFTFTAAPVDNRSGTLAAVGDLLTWQELFDAVIPFSPDCGGAPFDLSVFKVLGFFRTALGPRMRGSTRAGPRVVLPGIPVPGRRAPGRRLLGPGSCIRPSSPMARPVTGCGIERFCRSTPHARPWLAWSSRRIADSLDAVTRATGVRKITFVDENAVGPGRPGRAHAVQAAEELIRRGRPVSFNFACRSDDVDPATFRALRDAGLSGVTLGIEAMSQPTLDLFGRNTTPWANAWVLDVLADPHLDTEITYILFHPLATLHEIRDSVAFRRADRPHADCLLQQRGSPTPSWFPSREPR